ncbi:predicted protein [Sclerotinia sclerotiorum 1980 UF-70]|uniref:Uncharacterized protein n=1 Tax=Sclerotinia sclerotiorum (strain ATCC 18683 / 1980 / Ss-1) TaxID=665079 RepID=A7E933_SCLS1|nr:predicted protein [Sclerotinia sclerotiorum 1980 UF-70]EDN96885.1 predicted protein [Sclerotinia sclerotiorum 1980 UF-70]
MRILGGLNWTRLSCHASLGKFDSVLGDQLRVYSSHVVALENASDKYTTKL